jgi:hypothetical protein
METLSDFLDMYKFGNGSTLFCLKDMKQKAEAANNTELVDRVDAALALSNDARQKNYDWTMQKRREPSSRGAAAERDVQIDRTLGQIYDIVKAFSAMENDTPQKEAAARLEKQLFSQGVTPIMHSTFEEEHALVDELLERLRSDYSADASTLGLDALVDTLEQLNEKFGRELNITDSEAITFDQVSAARVAAEKAFHKVIFHAIGDYLDDDDTRRSMLAAVIDQQGRIARYRKRRGGIPSVDPDTGVVLDEDGEPLDGDDPTPTDTDDDPVVDTPAPDPQPALED